MREEEARFFPEAAAFRAWLDENHASADHLWVGYHRKASGRPSVTWEETVVEALCYGWIDGIRKSRDAESFMIRFTPRRPTSVWSRRNIELMERLVEEGRVKPAGLAAFAHKGVHRDSGYRAADAVELSAGLVARFKRARRAWRFFQAQPQGYRRSAARWVMGAKREETRDRRLSTLIADSGEHLRLKHLRKAEAAPPFIPPSAHPRRVPRPSAAPRRSAERIAVENVNTPGRVVMLDAAKHGAMRKALLKALPKRAPGLTQAEMFEAVLPHLPEDLFPGGDKAAWWAKSVQLDLEAKGVVVRERAAKPLRWHRA